MELLEMVHLTGRRFVALVLCGTLAAAAAVSYARDLPRDYEAESVIFASQLFRDARTDAELYTLVDDLILATELPQVTDAIDTATGLTHEAEYTLLADRAVAGGISVKLVSTAATAEDAETVVRSASRSALAFIAGQDQGRAEAARDNAAEALATTLAEMQRVEEEAGGVSPTVLVGQAEEQLATLINARGPLVATTPEESRLRARLVELRPISREYQQLEFLLEGYRNGLQTSLADVERTSSVTLALDSDIVVETRPEQASQVPLLVQAVLVAFGAVFAIGCLLFALLDRVRNRSSRRSGKGAEVSEAIEEPVQIEETPEPRADPATNGSAASTSEKISMVNGVSANGVSSNGPSSNGSRPKRTQLNGSSSGTTMTKPAVENTTPVVSKADEPSRRGKTSSTKASSTKASKNSTSSKSQAMPPTGKRPSR